MLDKFRNLTWLSAEPIFRMASGLVILLVVARQLGPAAFGTFTYAMALIALFQAFARFGQEGAIMRRMALEPDSGPATLASGMLVSCAVTCLATLTCLAFITFGWQSDGELAVPAFFVALAVMVIPGEVAYGYLKFREQVSSAVSFRLFVLLAGLAGMIALAIKGAEAPAFVAIRALEFAAAALIVMLLAWRLVRKEGPLMVDLARVKLMAAEGLPLLAYGLLAIAMLRVDQLMIGPMVGAEELGRYGVAVRVAELGNFAAMALTSSLFAAAGRNLAKDASGERYFQRFFDVYVLCGLAIAGALALASWLFLVPLLGAQYGAALPMVLILLCSTPLYFASVAFEMLRNLRGWLWTGVGLSASALLVNVAANLWLIPRLGGNGAAIATVLSLAIVGIGGALMLRHTRAAGFGMVRSLNPIGAGLRLWGIYGAKLSIGRSGLQGDTRK